MSYEDFLYVQKELERELDFDDPIRTAWRQGEYKRALELREKLQQKKAMETERIPSKYDLDATLESPTSNQTLNNTSVNTTIHNEIHEPPPSDVFNPGFRYQFSRP